MFFHIVVIKIRWELAEIEFAKKNSHFFTCGHNPLLITLKDFIQFSVWAKNIKKIIFFKKRFFRLRGLRGRTNIRNRFVWSQKTSPIASIDIVKNFKNTPKPARNVGSIYTNLASGLIYISRIPLNRGGLARMYTFWRHFLKSSSFLFTWKPFRLPLL